MFYEIVVWLGLKSKFVIMEKGVEDWIDLESFVFIFCEKEIVVFIIEGYINMVILQLLGLFVYIVYIYCKNILCKIKGFFFWEFFCRFF